MKRRNFGAALSALAVASCARMEERRPRYDPKECPFCSVKPGVCFYCQGSTKCSFCKGTGIRKTVSLELPEQGLKKTTYEEDCPYCKGSKVCRYCDGVGKCWACKGSGQIDSWDFYEQHKREKQDNVQSKPPEESTQQGSESKEQ